MATRVRSLISNFDMVSLKLHWLYVFDCCQSVIMTVDKQKLLFRILTAAL